MYSAEDETRGADASQLGVPASNTRRFHEDLKPIAGGRSEKKPAGIWTSPYVRPT